LASVITVGEGGAPASEQVLLVFHGDPQPSWVRLPDGPWQMVMDSSRGWIADDAETAPRFEHQVEVPPSTVLMLVQTMPHDPA
ncbi:hypothetical protein RZS08_20350, partial [Arthrospira platensis SPKY1]|nr:hypothetical protein [Arthrospira platensis SPKY1]